MASRIYPVAVVVFWISAMSWLVIAKVMPSLRRGDPPNHHLMSARQLRDNLPVVWDLRWNEHRIGWAATKVQDLTDDRTEILTQVRFTRWPDANGQGTTSWLMQQLAEWASTGASGRLCINNRARLDADGRLTSVDSSVSFGDAADAQPWMKINGIVAGGHLNLEFRLGDQLDDSPVASRSIPIRQQAMVANEISPRGYMPPLRLHQQWTTHHISPLRPPTGRQPPIIAKVERFEGMIWNNRAIETLLVVYRKDMGAGSRAADEYLGRMWVRPDDGMVLKQEVVVLGSRLVFVRRPAEAARPLAEMLDRQWSISPSQVDVDGLVPERPPVEN
jgi:hypothetical protein